MKNKLQILGLSLLMISSYAQVGINTNSPQSSLDVNGDITFRNELRVGGTKSVNGNPGTVNQILVSQGDNVAPQWRTSKLGFYEVNEYKMTASDAKVDEVGINFSNASNGDGIITSPAGESINSTSPVWTEIAGLASSFTVSNAVNRVNFMFQTGIEMSAVTLADQYVRFTCGIFVDNQLRAIRADQINGVTGKGQKNQSIFTLNYTSENAASGVHTVRVACRRITQSGVGVSPIYHLAIGRTTTDGTAIANNFMLNSVLKFDVTEQVRITN